MKKTTLYFLIFSFTFIISCNRNSFKSGKNVSTATGFGADWQYRPTQPFGSIRAWAQHGAMGKGSWAWGLGPMGLGPGAQALGRPRKL